jgi:hypothetical protein
LIPSPRFTAVLPTLLLASLVLAAGSGCGKRRPPLAPVEGEVTVNGKPLKTGRVVFYPAQGRSATGLLGQGGSFRLTTFDSGDGALLGEHVVTVTAMEESATGPSSFEEELRGRGIPLGDVRWLAAPKYAELKTSPLRATVEPGTNRFRFDLDGPPR